MRRINYLVTWSERHAGVALPHTIAPALRGPLTALACAIAFVIVIWGVQHARLRAAERDGAGLARRLAAAEPRIARVRTVEREVARLRTLGERVAQIRRSGTLRASEIAVVGNRLPPDAWLTSLRADHAALALEGRGARLGTVGSAIGNLAQLPSYSGARLISVREEPARSGVTYAIALEPRR
jgi:Tfp pilus assembly protein PilN